jgi:peptidyl-prolyl cis-trans isomerase D
MLEAIRERSQGLFAKLILALIVVPFALWGVDSYFKNTGDGNFVAKVDGYKVTRQEFDKVLKEQQDRLRGSLKESYDPTLLDKPEARQAIVDNLITQHLLAAEAGRSGILVPDAEVAAIIGGIEAFQLGGKFSQENYERLLRQQGMSPAMFEMRVRQELAVQQLRHPYAETAFLPVSSVERFIKVFDQQREVSQVRFAADKYMAQVKLDSAAVKAYYDGHHAEFATPEQVRLEYVVLSVDNLALQMSVTDEEIKRFFDENAKRFQEPEERQASHILINVPANATAAVREAAKKKADQVYQEAKQNPGKFAELAKKYSQDPGSAEQGGDLGMFARGAMVKPFEDAVFQMKVGDVREPVQSDFGYHIIKLTGIKPAKGKGIDQAKSEIASELKRQKAGKKFAEVAETFSNAVYEQAESLKPAADAAKIAVQTSQWVAPAGKGGAAGDPLLNNEKLLKAVFSPEVLKNHRNTEAVEVRPNTLLAARVIEHRPESVKALDAVSTQIESRLKREQAMALAIRDGEAKLAQLQKGTDAGVSWGTAQLVGRQNPQGVNPANMPQLFKVDVAKLPAYVGVDSPQDGYTLYKVSRVVEAGQPNAAKVKAFAENLRQMVAQESFNAYVASLKQKASIKIVKENLEKVER